MRIPRATYRLQFNPDFGFRDAKRTVSYLSELGISDLYASPIFKARRKSMHGYDVVDPTSLNAELGGEADFRALAQELKAFKMGWLQDVIPNHMAFDYENRMLMDVLEIGKASAYYNYFDIEWEHAFETMQGRLLAPFLGNSYGDSIRNREIIVKYGDAGFTVNYYNWKFPLTMESYAKILSLNLDQLRKRLGSDHPNLIKFMGMLYVMQVFPGQELPSKRYDQRKFVKNMLWELYQGEREIKRFIDRNLDELNGKRPSKAPNLLDELLFGQFFRLSFWKVAGEEVNYRRFFNINELISVRIEDEEVFENCHSLILRLIREAVFTGLRIDHIDGLYDPSLYLQRLQEK
ncbi:MAG: alpha-amylase family glycosyl hydrolase, partial [Desulforhabdus sp.]|nr:alpha-amylase family glycosyl hydrolase [Desulforhabdus sp.]